MSKKMQFQKRLLLLVDHRSPPKYSKFPQEQKIQGLPSQLLPLHLEIIISECPLSAWLGLCTDQQLEIMTQVCVCVSVLNGWCFTEDPRTGILFSPRLSLPFLFLSLMAGCRLQPGIREVQKSDFDWRKPCVLLCIWYVCVWLCHIFLYSNPAPAVINNKGISSFRPQL